MVPGLATLQGHTGSLPGVVFSSPSSHAQSSPLLLRQPGFSAAQSALDAGRLDFDTCLALLQEVLHRLLQLTSTLERVPQSMPVRALFTLALTARPTCLGL